MSLSGVFSTAVSGLQASQTALRTVSDNVANVDTPGYVRKVADLQSLGQGVGGVGVASVQRAADQFLQSASLSGTADAGRAGAVSDLIGQAQGLFGDPSATGSLFSSLDGVFTAFTTLASNPSSAGRAQAVSQVQAFFDQGASVSAGLTALQGQADQRIGGDVTQLNTLLTQIDGLNGAIARASVAGGDASDAQNQQSQLIDQVSKLVDVKVAGRPDGGVTLRAADGTALAGDGAAVFAYDPSGGVGRLTVTPAGGAPGRATALASGEIKGLLDLRNTDLPGVQGQLAELVSQTAAQLNAAHNASSAVPAPAALTGRDIGIDLPTALGGFTGKTTVAILDPSGAVVRQAAVDFDAKTITVAGGAATAFTSASFLSTLNTALAPAGSASTSGNALSLSAAGGNGVAVVDDATSPSQKAGKGFSAFFGLNDLVAAKGIADYATGLSASDPGGFTGQVKLRLTGADGSWLKDATVTAPPGGSVGDLVAALNAPSTGVGLFGAFALDASGRLAFIPAAGSGVGLSVAADTTQRGAGGPSVSALFGIGDAVRGARASAFSVRSDIAASPARLALAHVTLSGAPALLGDDVSGADALGQAGRATTTFGAAGGLAASTQSVSDFASALAAGLSSRSANADQAKSSAQAVSSAADARRSSGEGVNLDEELVKLTTYQQAYNASARLIQAGKDMYDTLLQLTR